MNKHHIFLNIPGAAAINGDCTVVTYVGEKEEEDVKKELVEAAADEEKKDVEKKVEEEKEEVKEEEKKEDNDVEEAKETDPLKDESESKWTVKADLKSSNVSL